MERKPAYQFLKEFYAERGITEEMDLKGKEHALEGLILIPYYPAGKKHALWELEQQLLRNNGYMV